MIDPQIFKAFDMRAIYPTQLDVDGMYQIGRAFVEHLNVNEVVLANDMRKSIPVLKPALIKGINDAGAKVIDIGMTGTEVMYFTVGKFGYESGIMMTASHNPKEYIGLKMVSKGAYPIGADTGIYDIRDLAVLNKYKPLNKPQNVTQFDPHEALVEQITNLVDLTKINSFKVVVDAGNGVGGKLFSTIFKDTKLEVIPLYFEPDGTFPNHEANPIKEENVQDLIAKVLETKADLGIALDGDGDRVFFIDKNGAFSLGYFILPLLAKKILELEPGTKIVHENRNMWAILDTIEKYGGIAVQSMAGHSYIKAKMRDVDAVFGGETSSHFFYRDMFYADSSMLTIALILQLMTDTEKGLAELLAELKSKYFISGEINYVVEHPIEILKSIEKHYKAKGYEIDKMDGVAVNNKRKWRFSLRQSNTEAQPIIRFNSEGKDQETVSKITKEVEQLVKDFDHE